jgi:predicted pyridoxine 5'-phosphate oxidase superfamily flavin-nucleotide-binding protein
MTETKIFPEMMTALQGVVPSIVGTCSLEGIPNVTYISQVYYVDATHVALSHQFLNKTKRNIEENPMLCVYAVCPIKYKMYKMLLSFVESQSSGDIFEEMAVQLEAIASISNKVGVFKLQSADIYKVLSIEIIG